MAETITAHLGALADITTLNLFLHSEDTGALLNAAGDALVHLAGGVFQAVLAESRDGLGHLYAIVCDGDETTANIVWEGWLPSAAAHLVEDYPGGDATLEKQDQILTEVRALGSPMTEAY